MKIWGRTFLLTGLHRRYRLSIRAQPWSAHGGNLISPAGEPMLEPLAQELDARALTVDWSRRDVDRLAIEGRRCGTS